MRLLLTVFMLLPTASAVAKDGDLCRYVNDPSRYSGKMVEVQAYIKPLMHGTYLKQDGCDQSLLVVLPDEIPNYKGAVKVVKDTAFEAFEKARFNYQPDASPFSATFVGEIEYAKRGKGFGYNKNHRVRLVLQGVH